MRTTEVNGIPVFAALAAACAVAAGCGDGRRAGPYGDYDEEKVTVIGAEDPASGAGTDRVVVSGSGGAGECAQISDALCVPVDTDTGWCEREGGPVDVVIVEGEVVDVICYPPAEDEDRPTENIDSTSPGEIQVAQNASNTTVVFHDDTNGQPIEGDLDVAGNNVAVYGNGVDNTIIDGDVSIDGNNVRMRGLTITGNLLITKNSAAIVLCRVLGNVVIDLNGSVLVESDVFGDVSISSNSNLIAGNDVMGGWELDGHNNNCDANHSFSDTNEDQWVSDDERSSETLPCSQAPGP